MAYPDLYLSLNGAALTGYGFGVFAGVVSTGHWRLARCLGRAGAVACLTNQLAYSLLEPLVYDSDSRRGKQIAFSAQTAVALIAGSRTRGGRLLQKWISQQCLPVKGAAVGVLIPTVTQWRFPHFGP